MRPTQITAYDKWAFTSPVKRGQTITHDVYSRGKGKMVVIIQELPGIGQETLALADRFVNRGYQVILPHLFGPLGKTSTLPNAIRVMCLRKEFRIFSANESSPVVDWLKALCRKMKEDFDVKGVAVIGMCLTGNFAISLIADDSVLAGYASQPSLPILKQRALHLSQKEAQIIRQKLADIGPMHCGRFKKDPLCKSSKFQALNNAFNSDGIQRMILHELPGKGHSILTLDFIDHEHHPTYQLLEEVIAYFDEALAES